MNKNPWIAAILNLIMGGLGYIYVGKRVLFGTLLLIGDLFVYYWVWTDPSSNIITEKPSLIFVSIVYVFAFAYDGYKNAQEVNKSK